MSPRKPIKVLDLYCGDGIVRFPTVARYPGRSVEYTGIDLHPHIPPFSLLESQARLERALRYRAERTKEPMEDPAKARARFSEQFHQAKLNFNDPRALRESIMGIVGAERFDEIHFHLHDQAWANAKGAEALQVLGDLLKPGGRLYHLFQGSSPLMNPQDYLRLRETARTSWPEEHIFRQNQGIVQRAAAQAGLKLDKYGLVRLDRGRRPFTFTGETLNISDRKKREQLSTRYEDLIPQYTKFAGYADHFFILRKPLQPRREQRG